MKLFGIKPTFVMILFLLFAMFCSSGDDNEVKTYLTGVKQEYNRLVVISGPAPNSGEYYISRNEDPIIYKSNEIVLSKSDIHSVNKEKGPGLYTDWHIEYDKSQSDTGNPSCGIATPRLTYIIIPFQDDTQLPVKNYGKVHDLGDGIYLFPLNFSDQTYNTPETHTYRIELWNCKGYCEPDELDKKTEKKAEISVTVNYTP